MAAAIRSCVDLLKPGAPLLLYLYYTFDNCPLICTIWRISDLGRRLIRRLPPGPKNIATDAIALLVYLPLGVLSRITERLRFSPPNIPLSYYRNHSFYTMRADARDRFGTRLEHRFTRKQIAESTGHAGLENVCFSESAPY